MPTDPEDNRKNRQPGVISLKDPVMTAPDAQPFADRHVSINPDPHAALADFIDKRVNEEIARSAHREAFDDNPHTELTERTYSGAPERTLDPVLDADHKWRTVAEPRNPDGFDGVRATLKKPPHAVTTASLRSTLRANGHPHVTFDENHPISGVVLIAGPRADEALEVIADHRPAGVIFVTSTEFYGMAIRHALRQMRLRRETGRLGLVWRAVYGLGDVIGSLASLSPWQP